MDIEKKIEGKLNFHDFSMAITRFSVTMLKFCVETFCKKKFKMQTSFSSFSRLCGNPVARNVIFRR